MYIYVTPDPHNPESEVQIVGLGPSTRGKPAKNHAQWSGIPFAYMGVLTADDAAKAKNVADARDLVAKNAAAAAKFCSPGGLVNITLGANKRVTCNRVADALVAAITNPALPVNPAIVPTLNALTTALKAVSVTTAPMETFGELILRNRKLIVSILCTYPTGGWWHSDASSIPAAPSTSVETATPPELKIKNAATEDEHPETVKMATTTDFGFGRMSGTNAATSTAAAPTLRVAAGTDAGEIAAGGVFLPKTDDTYIINDDIANLFKILQISRQNSPQNVKLVGPHGCGKTELAIQFAAGAKLPLLIMDCANLREARDWFGYKSAREGTVYWHESQFVRAVEAGNHVILLDELNRANPHLLNTLMPLLDGRRFTYLEEKGDKICVGPGTVFFASMNEGAGYTGTSALDRAIRDRFPRAVELTYLGEADEIQLLVRRVGIDVDTATRLVQMANKIREEASGMTASLTDSMSTRQLIAAAQDFAIGGVETLTFTIINHFSADGDDDSERVRVQNIIQGKFGDLLAAAAESKAKKGA